MTQYLSVAEALFFHQDQIERFGGADGVRDPGALEAALARPQSGYYPNLIHEAAALLQSLVQNNPFVDGNKRTGFAVMDVFLRVNGYRLNADSMAIHAKLIQLLESQQFDFDHLVAWLTPIVEKQHA